MKNRFSARGTHYTKWADRTAVTNAVGALEGFGESRQTKTQYSPEGLQSVLLVCPEVLPYSSSPQLPQERHILCIERSSV